MTQKAYKKKEHYLFVRQAAVARLRQWRRPVSAQQLEPRAALVAAPHRSRRVGEGGRTAAWREPRAGRQRAGPDAQCGPAAQRHRTRADRAGRARHQRRQPAADGALRFCFWCRRSGSAGRRLSRERRVRRRRRRSGPSSACVGVGQKRHVCAAEAAATGRRAGPGPADGLCSSLAPVALETGLEQFSVEHQYAHRPAARRRLRLSHTATVALHTETTSAPKTNHHRRTTRCAYGVDSGALLYCTLVRSMRKLWDMEFAVLLPRCFTCCKIIVRPALFHIHGR